MSSTFNLAFVSTLAPAATSSPSAFRAPLLRAIVGWLGLVREQYPSVAAPVQRKSWEQQQRSMLVAGDQMLARSRSDNQPISVAVFDLDDLPELESVFGAALAREVMTQVVSRLQGMVGSRGLVMRTDATVFTVLMPGFGRDRAHQAIERTMGSPCCIELDSDDHEIVLVPEFKVHTIRPDSEPLAQVYAELRREISAAQRLERQRQRYLRQERQSHTRPAELLAQAERAPGPARRRAARPIEPTIPMPLSR